MSKWYRSHGTLSVTGGWLFGWLTVAATAYCMILGKMPLGTSYTNSYAPIFVCVMLWVGQTRETVRYISISTVMPMITAVGSQSQRRHPLLCPLEATIL